MLIFLCCVVFLSVQATSLPSAMRRIADSGELPFHAITVSFPLRTTSSSPTSWITITITISLSCHHHFAALHHHQRSHWVISNYHFMSLTSHHQLVPFHAITVSFPPRTTSLSPTGYRHVLSLPLLRHMSPLHQQHRLMTKLYHHHSIITLQVCNDVPSSIF